MVPSDVRQLVERRKQEIISGKRLVFTGPLKDQSGKVRIPVGKAMRIEELMGMDWFVEGVVGQIPKK
jgi:basic membrane protein A